MSKFQEQMSDLVKALVMQTGRDLVDNMMVISDRSGRPLTITLSVAPDIAAVDIDFKLGPKKAE